MRLASGIKLLGEVHGTGRAAQRGDEVTLECAGNLWTGQVVHDRVRQTTRIGSRQLIAGVEKTLVGMREGGYRRVRVSPHLAYRDMGVTGAVPPNAALDFEVWLLVIEKSAQP
jgi:FKBP-type peptidyl-prolyl cis-trans isomerase